LLTVRYESVHCSVTVQHPGRGVIVVRLTGHDVGELGDAPFRALAGSFEGVARVQLFLDARDSRGASPEVSHEWAQWLRAHRDRFEHISILTGSRFIQITADFVRRFAQLGDLMRIYTDPAAFDAALGSATVPTHEPETATSSPS
jgi:hypothetical protein